MGKLYGTFKNINNDDVTVYIINDKIPDDIIIGDDENSDIQFCYDSPVVIADEANDTHQHIRPKSCTINLLTKIYLGDLLYSNKDIDTTVSIYVNDVCKFAGFLTPTVFSQSYARNWERLTLNCIDYLSVLEYILPTDTVDYETLKSQADVYSMKKYLQDFVFNNTDLLNRDNQGTSKIYYDMSVQASADGSTIPVSTTTWTSSDTSICTVDSGGHVYARQAGTCTITGQCMYDSSQTVTYEVTVTNATPYIVIKNIPDEVYNTAGIGDVLITLEYDRVPITDTVTYPDLQWVETRYVSSDEQVLDVETTGVDTDRRGIVYITGYGTATITVQDMYSYVKNGATVTECLQSDSFTCTVANEVTGLEITDITPTEHDPNIYNISYTIEGPQDAAVTFYLEDEQVARIVNNRLVVHASGPVRIYGYVNSNHDIRAEKLVNVDYHDTAQTGQITGTANGSFTINIGSQKFTATPDVNTHKWTISGISPYGSSLQGLFSGYTQITSIQSIQGYVDEVTNTSRMFNSCATMHTCYLPDFISLTNTNEMFRNCTVLQSIYLSGNESLSVTCTNMFNGCSSIQNIEFDGIQVSEASHMFDGCDSLQSVTLHGATPDTMTIVRTSLEQSFPTKTITVDDNTIYIS